MSSQFEKTVVIRTIYRASQKGTQETAFGYFDNLPAATEAVQGRGTWAGHGQIDEVTGIHFVDREKDVFLVDFNQPIQVYSDLKQHKRAQLRERLQRILTPEEMELLGII